MFVGLYEVETPCSRFGERIFISSTLETKWAQREKNPKKFKLHFFFSSFFVCDFFLFICTFICTFVCVPTDSSCYYLALLLLLLVIQTLEQHRESYMACPLNVPSSHNPFSLASLILAKQHLLQMNKVRKGISLRCYNCI